MKQKLAQIVENNQIAVESLNKRENSDLENLTRWHNAEINKQFAGIGTKLASQIPYDNLYWNTDRLDVFMFYGE